VRLEREDELTADQAKDIKLWFGFNDGWERDDQSWKIINNM